MFDAVRIPRIQISEGGTMTEISTGIKHPRNSSPMSKGTIHDDKVAEKLGFRGGAIAGSIHLDQFGPALVEVFGQEWFETGSLGLFFIHPLKDQEPVEGFITMDETELPLANARVSVSMKTPDDILVAEGSASVGSPTTASPVSSRDRRSVAPSSLRMMAKAEIGMQLGPVVMSPSEGDQRERVTSGMMTAPLDWYVNESPWGGPICSPLTVSRILTTEIFTAFSKKIGIGVGLYGALELNHIDGPLFLDEDYVVTGVLTDVSETPKTEVFWCDMEARRANNPDAGLVATFTAMIRVLKASSPLYND